MNTIIGLTAEKNERSVILASDLLITENYRTKQEVRNFFVNNIFVNNDNSTVLAITGVYDNLTTQLLNSFQSGEIDIERIVNEGFFPQLREMNTVRVDGRTFEGKSYTELLLATNYHGRAELYICWPLGKVEYKDWAVLGPKSDDVLNSWNSLCAQDGLENIDQLDPGNLDIDDALRFAVVPPIKANLYFDELNFLYAVTSEGIYADLSNMLREEWKKSKRRAIRDFKKIINGE